MYVKNFMAKSKLSEPKNRKRLARKQQKTVTATTNTINCKNCTITNFKNYCPILCESIAIQYDHLNNYLFEIRLGIETKQYLNDKLTMVKHSANEIIREPIVK